MCKGTHKYPYEKKNIKKNIVSKKVYSFVKMLDKIKKNLYNKIIGYGFGMRINDILKKTIGGENRIWLHSMRQY